MKTESRSPQAILKTEVDRRKFQKHPLEMMHEFLFTLCCALKTSEMSGSVTRETLPLFFPLMCVRAHACRHTYAHVHMHNLASIYNLPVEWQEYFLFDQGR